MVLIAPPSLIAARRLRPQTACALGLALASAAILGLIVVGVWEDATWWPQASEWGRRYVVHRYLFAVVTLTDAPLLEALAVGGGVWFVGLKRLNGLPAQ